VTFYLLFRFNTGGATIIVFTLSNSTHTFAMPTYHIEMIEGRTLEQKKKLVEAITRVSVEVLGGEPNMVDILITDVKRENWATGGVLWTEPRS
jgi:4-oxalocrotonate tautomerase